jgi:hypothetical protein
MPTFFARGRIAWICSIVLGIILAIVGAAAIHPASVFLIGVGAAFFLFGVVFLIISFATGGAAD